MVLAAAAYASWRSWATQRLYAEAMGYPAYFRSTAESVTAVRKLAAFHGRRVTGMLLDIAGRSGELAGDAGIEAVGALRERKEPEVADALADLLQPHTSLALRQAVASALPDLPCGSVCIRSILHYLERIAQGELNTEDRLTLPAGAEGVAASLKRAQQAAYDGLYSVLKQQKLVTLAVMESVYGLGTAEPSPFALDLVSRLELPDACPLLVQSDRDMRNLPAEHYRLPREEVQASLSELRCR